MSDEVLKLTLLSRKTGETKTVTVHHQQMADWGTDDLISRVEGRSSQILPADETPEAYAAAYGWKFEESTPGVFVMTVPSWVGAVNSDRTVRSRQALYQFVVSSMTKVQSTPKC